MKPRHVVAELPEMRRHWLGVDYGTTNATSAVLLGLGVDDRLYVCAEWRHDSRATHRQMTDAQYSAAIRAWLQRLNVSPEWTFVDPSAASFSTQFWHDAHPGLARAKNDVRGSSRGRWDPRTLSGRPAIRRRSRNIALPRLSS
ncbi:hypothetical protein [Streptomyces sp. NPDC057696]|uniref:hypothetical protein n=1 Tax=Streptomyces sp. NPDC057696 TaxID=3346218 RepID=UPI0036ABA343